MFTALVILEMSFYLYILFREQLVIIVRMLVLPCKLFWEQLRRKDPPGIREQLAIIVCVLVLPHKLFPEQI